MSLLDDLNPVQRKAVLETEGPLLVFAGAGSGKTRVLTYRIAYLIQEKRVSPWNIFAVTFTNKAAGEMRERVEKLLGRSARGTWISTFHSACARILREHIERLGFKRNFVIYDDEDQERHLKAVMKEMELDPRIFHPRAVQSKIESLKNEGITPEQFRADPYNIFQKRVAVVYQRYQEDLQRNNALDFGDLLTFVAVLFRRFPEVLKSYQDLCRYVLVDEFQDTNMIQYHLIQRIVEMHRNICVVGDDDQSIYRWRGAEVGNILNFEKDFPHTKVITLEQNYRSTQTILEAANHVVRQNRSRKAKVLWTENSGGEPVTLYVAGDEGDEARFVVRKILEQRPPIGGTIAGLRDIAVFYRINAQSRALEEELVRHQIPYTIVGGLKFYERKEIKDVLAYLKLIANPSDGLSLKRIINLPPRGIGQKTIEKMEAYSKGKRIPLYEGMKRFFQEDSVPASVREKIEEFLQLVEDLRTDMTTQSLSGLTLILLNQTGYLNRLKEEATEEAFARIENIDELINVMVEFEKEQGEASLEAFLDKVSLVTDVDLYENKGDRVSLMTLHCAKGLEFPVVFVVGMEEGLLPHYRRGDEIEDLEEERRLCYVGITRTKEKLFLSRSEKRSTFGVGRVNLPSRFLNELPMELIRTEKRRERFEPLFSEREGLFAPPKSEGDGVAGEERVLTPEGLFPLRMGMQVRHPKFGKGRVISTEGADEEQRATVQFETVGSKRLKVRYANLEILE